MSPDVPDADTAPSGVPEDSATQSDDVGSTPAEARPATYASRSAAAAMNRAAREAQIELNTSIHRLLSALVIGGVLYTCYFARELILPILLAAFFALLLSPLMKRLAHPWLPRWVTALLIMGLFFVTVAGSVIH